MNLEVADIIQNELWSLKRKEKRLPILKGSRELQKGESSQL